MLTKAQIDAVASTILQLFMRGVYQQVDIAKVLVFMWPTITEEELNTAKQIILPVGYKVIDAIELRQEIK